VVAADPLTGDVFLFINRRQSLVKALYWDRTGFCILAKRLERGRFELRHEGVQAEMSVQEVQLLLDGVFSRRRRKMRAFAK
jgi:transposase